MANETSLYGELAVFDPFMRPLVKRLIAGIADNLSLSGSDQLRQLPPLGYPREIDKGDGVVANGDNYVFGIAATMDEPPIEIRVVLAPKPAATGSLQDMEWTVTYENVKRATVAGSVPTDDDVRRACAAVVDAALTRRQQAIARGEIRIGD